MTDNTQSRLSRLIQNIMERPELFEDRRGSKAEQYLFVDLYNILLANPERFPVVMSRIDGNHPEDPFALLTIRCEDGSTFAAVIIAPTHEFGRPLDVLEHEKKFDHSWRFWSVHYSVVPAQSEPATRH